VTVHSSIGNRICNDCFKLLKTELFASYYSTLSAVDLSHDSVQHESTN